MSKFDEMVYGNNNHRRERRVGHDDDNPTGEIMEMGKMAVGGLVVAGLAGAVGSAFRRE